MHKKNNDNIEEIKILNINKRKEGDKIGSMEKESEKKEEIKDEKNSEKNGRNKRRKIKKKMKKQILVIHPAQKFRKIFIEI